MTDGAEELISRLAGHQVTGKIPRTELEWLAANGHPRRLEPGDVLTSRAAGIVEGMFIILRGHIALYAERANGREKIMDWRGGDISGMLPYSRLAAPPGDSVAEEPTELLMIHRADIPDMIRECHGLTSALVHVMIDRARQFTSNDLRAEKMASLGKLSAGLAHELNNPAAAIARSARALHGAIATSEEAARTLGALALTAEQKSAIEEARAEALRPVAHAVRTPLEQADREAAFEDWLFAHGGDPSDAGPLAETEIPLELLDRLGESFSGRELGTAVRWLAATCATRQLADEIETAATRISSLVEAVKGFTQMDLSTKVGPVDITSGLTQTLTLHGSKARGKGVSVRIAVDPKLPRAIGVAGELNQVWSNLIDNALDAVEANGSIVVTAAEEGGQVVVRVTDSGHGIPAEIQSRIFDPFFTTKKVGHGTGLGLDIVKRIIQKHKGTIGVESAPGRTQFRVALPKEASE